ncbi:MAG: SDR family oxidoreductase [Flammeovirgaceae bacterium]|jgi:short-subunit dehydrogenase|nr:SDR family oxidoreductase [Flammeovirgaceae bacterium]|tara:strand:+ start:5547 stop:6242 length:696 start_codon:yes stop_codon:yes gene_type:complete
MYCIVTGGTEGIGKAVINRFAQEGFDIITCARNIEKLNYLKLDLENRYPIKVHVFRVDLSIKEEVLNFGSMVNALAVPEVLVNNAGVFLPGMIETEVDGALEHMINTNLYSAYHLTRSLMPEMKRLKKGYIFNMCSIASIKAYANGGSYGISKFALYGMTKVLREELKEFNIKVTAVLPGATLTASWEGVDLPEERFIKVEDIAELIWTTYRLSDRTVVEDLVIRPQLGDI